MNFGVFALYGDPALDVAMDMAFKLLLSVPVEEVTVCNAADDDLVDCFYFDTLFCIFLN